TLDLKKPEGQEALRRLARDADVVFNNLRGDLPIKLGLTYAQLKDVNPSLVCGHLSAYGRTGSRAAWPGYDYLMQAEAGYLSLTPSQLYKTKDSWIFLMCNKEKFWGVLANCIGKPEWADAAHYKTFRDRLENRDQITEELDAVLQTATTAEWMERFAGKVPA